jgi:hypothetical protein
VTKWKDAPFALLGVNVNGFDVAQLKQAVEKENLTWRSFADPGPIMRTPIVTRWNLDAIPTLYLLDAKGVIRNKWLGESDAAALDAAIEALVAEARGR